MEKDQLKQQTASPGARFGKRHVQVTIMAMSSFVVYALRVILSVAIVPMTGQDLHKTVNSRAQVNSDVNNNLGATLIDGFDVYDWDESTQSLILSSFFFGYLITQVPAGILGERFGGHRLLSCGLFAASLLTALLPPCAYLGGWWLVCIIRVLQGISQGLVYPGIYAMMGLWLPPAERVTMAGIILSAQNLGPVGANPMAGFLASYSGWPSIFYAFGGWAFLMALTVFYLGADSPATHSTISADERHYIEQSRGGAKEKMPVPWGSVLRSPPVWAAYIAHAFTGGVFLTFLTEIPKYLSNVLQFDIKENGLISALPYVACWCLAYVVSFTCNVVISREWLTVTQARKVFNSIGQVGPAITMVVLGYSTDPTLCVTLLTLSVALTAASYQGSQSCFMDLTPNFASAIFGIGNCMSATVGLCGPLIIGLIVTEPSSAYQWRMVFFVLAGAMFLSNVLFLVCASAEVQPWNSPKRKESVSSKT